MSDQIHLISILLYIIISVDIYLYIRAEILQRVWWLRLPLYSWNQAFLLRIQGAQEQYQIHSLQKSKVQELSYIYCLLYVSENSPCCVVIGQKKKTLSAVLFYRSWKNIAFRIKIYCLLWSCQWVCDLSAISNSFLLISPSKSNKMSFLPKNIKNSLGRAWFS